jgi:ATP-dependent helicase YprA (DUF1998 family)
VSELLPSAQAREIRDGLLDYLTTTFALADPDARLALAEFLGDQEYGIFKGPFLRLRLPFRAAADGWQSILGWDIGLTPYGHQAAAFARLSSADLGPDKLRPLPTLVTTGTGSGKTEAFLYPILDHVLRTRRDEVAGMKALILYPMNALANDQAKRLADLLTTREELAGITAALYTGQEGPQRTRVSADGLITDRAIIRDVAPDILLTNYKMLDQLLLRHDDAALWRQSAASLQYLVLDEFHSYDGAQGTDVAMLLRRLGLTLKSYLPDGALTDAERARPLGRVTPVATSATLGDQGDPAAMMSFARTVFGDDEFGDGSVVTESRLSLAEWTRGGIERVLARGLVPRRPARADLAAINAAVTVPPRGSTRKRTLFLLAQLYGTDIHTMTNLAWDDPALLLSLVQAHPLVHEMVGLAGQAVHLSELADRLFPEPAAGPVTADEDERVAFLTHVAASLSHIRVAVGRAALGVDLHLWVRELSRIDRLASATPRYRWSDDGELAGPVDLATELELRAFPAIYCRHCGRSGWGVGLAPVGPTLDNDDTTIRRNHAAHEGRFRALLYAPLEAVHAPSGEDPAEPGGEAARVEGLRWLSVRQRVLLSSPPAEDDPDYRDGWILPVLTQVGPDADDESRDDTCPSCQQKDGIRFLGTAIATLLSVTLSTMFGDEALDAREKKALVFTDSVQDAAHRAGFVESRSHALTLRSLLRDAVGDHPVTLDALVGQAIRGAGDDLFRRYRIIPPDLVERAEFKPFWERDRAGEIPIRVRTRVRRRLLFDAVLEFGLQSRIGRTLEQTGSVVAEVDAGEPAALASIARAVLTATETDTLDSSLAVTAEKHLVAWVRGVLERMRTQGAIEHEWFRDFITHDGNRYFIWGGRPRGQGMPAFPRGRAAPSFPRIGPAPKVRDPLLDAVTTPQSWYARWTARVLGVTAGHGARLARQLLERLARAEVLHTVATEGGGTVFTIPASAVIVSPTDDAAMATGDNLLTCTVCRTQQPGTAAVIAQLNGAPCMLVRCPGRLHPERRSDNYYRRLYASTDMRRIVAREHTGLVDDETRLKYESEFKQSTSDPGAPNVLVATPTLEMGIDIGDLSAVLLASLPKTVASYLQRVGRAGRLTGSALNLAFITGRGEQLPRLQDPLSVINGQVRPPATYLSAEEILRRQYVAYLMDCFARTDDRPHPRRARGALGSAEPGTFLGELIRFAEEGAADHLDRFLGCFDGLAASSVESLRGWAAPRGGEPGASGLAAHLYDASRRWVAAVEGLAHRRAAIEAALPELMARDASPAASDDDRRALRSARAALLVTRAESQRLTGEYWIAVLEEFGVLPNYTLLDDRVTLDVSVSWIDPETQEYHEEPRSFQRSSANALREFAPGSTFYARGLEILIDAVDLGPDDSAIRPMAFCPNCGFAVGLSAPGPAGTAPAICPRCGGAGMSGTEYRLDAVELARVSAQLRRDEAAISDRSDERRREYYTVAVAADIDPAYVARRWYVNDFDFGTKYLRRMVIRWVNLGRAGSHGATRPIAGEQFAVPLFRVCEGCGVLDKSAGANRPDEHRAWCRFRKDPDEHVRNIALTRTLTTQGAVIRLPQSVTLGDQFAIPSLAAALLLGLQEQIGGSPDHIDVAAISEPVAGHDGATAQALLLHDVVPGGTGYLAELADPERVWDLLHRAWERVRDCPCQHEQRLACHRCLVPFAAVGALSRVSRSAAERHLRTILTAGTPDATPAAAMSWSLTSHEPGLPSPESHLEQAFRKVFTERVAALGATVKETPGPLGNRLAITFPGGTRQWTLEPQVPMGGSRPDFVLRSSQGSLRPVAIFTDGWLYHASPAHNRIADDARKRQELRDQEVIVLGVTAQDVARAQDNTYAAPGWLRDDVIAALMSSTVTFRPQNVENIRRGPIDFLLSWIQSPDIDGQRVLANRLPFLFAPDAAHFAIDAAADLAAEAARRLADPDRVTPVGETSATAWWWSAGPVGLLTRTSGDDLELGRMETALIIDDRAESLADKDQSASGWREWLRISNALTLREQPTIIAALTEVNAAAGSAAAKPAATPPEGLDSPFPPQLQTAYDLATSGAEKAFVRELARHEARDRQKPIPAPVVGFETDDGIPIDFAWPGAKIAVCLNLDDNDRHDLEAGGWHVLPPNDPDAVYAALREAA